MDEDQGLDEGKQTKTKESFSREGTRDVSINPYLSVVFLVKFINMKPLKFLRKCWAITGLCFKGAQLRCLGQLTFAFGQPDNSYFFHISFMLGTLDLIG